MQRKAIFDAVRRMLGRGFRRAEIAALDAAIDTAQARQDFSAMDCVTGGPCLSGSPCTISSAGVALIKRFEGCARVRPDGLVEAYPDPGTGGAPWTIGWGATGRDIGPDTVWTQTECDERLERDLARYASEVIAAIGTAHTSQSQFDAMVSFHYNTGAIDRATLTKMHRDGRFLEAAEQFTRWVYAGGRSMNGLIRRRQAEAAHYGGRLAA